MLERVQDYYMSEPRRLVSLGAALVRLGGFLLVAGLAGRMATIAMATAHGLAGGGRTDIGLANVLPAFLSWWMPESVIGFGLSLLLVASGLVAARTGRLYQRAMGA
jgi:hypothetical protein